MSLMYLVPIIAVTFDIRIADVTYPAFVGHSLPAVAVMILFASAMKRDGFLRPRWARVLAWEKVLFVMLQWPWVLWGCAMAVRDRLTGGFVDFQITPKGAQPGEPLPGRIIAVYALLAVGAAVPVLLVSEVTDARGFYLLSLFNTCIYLTLLTVALVSQLRRARGRAETRRKVLARDLPTLTLIMALFFSALTIRAEESLHALAVGLDALGLVRVQHVISGAGMGGVGDVRVKFEPFWSDAYSNR